MATKLCVFVSSVQKELEDERLIVQNIINTDGFLSAHCSPVLYEFEPASPLTALDGSTSLPPKPITLANLRKGRYRPCSRNPVLAQCLSYFHRIEARGSGFRWMRDQMLDHGLDHPLIATDMGYFQVIFNGPGANVERLRVPETGLMVTPTIKAQLNDRQRDMLSRLVGGEELTSRQCQKRYKLSPQAVYEDFQKLTELGIVHKIGLGRSTRYGYNPHE